MTTYNVATTELYAGDTVDAVTGAVLRPRQMILLYGSDDNLSDVTGGVAVKLTVAGKPSSTALCSHFPATVSSDGTTVILSTTDHTATTLEIYASAQMAAGTPIQILYELATAVSVTAAANSASQAATSVTGAVKYNETQTLTSAQKAVACGNIGADARYANALIVTESGNPLTIYPNPNDGEAITSLQVAGNTIVAGSGTASPTNIRAISGVGGYDKCVTIAYDIKDGIC